MEDLKQRANFEVYLKKFLQSMDIILPNAAANPLQDSRQAVRLSCWRRSRTATRTTR